MQNKVPAGEIEASYAALQAENDVRGTGSGDQAMKNRAISFRSFMALLREPSTDSLDLYDDRHEGTVSTLHTGHGSGKSPLLGSGDFASAPGSARSRNGSLTGTELSRHGERSSLRGGRNLCTVFERAGGA